MNGIWLQLLQKIIEAVIAYLLSRRGAQAQASADEVKKMSEEAAAIAGQILTRIVDCGAGALVIFITTKDYNKAIQSFMSCLLGGTGNPGTPTNPTPPAGPNLESVKRC